MADLVTREPAGRIVGGFAITQVEARFQVRVKAIAKVGGDALAGTSALVLITVGFRIGEADVIVGVPQHLPRTDFTLSIAATADLIAHLQLGRVQAGAGDVIDRTAQSQRALIEPVGATQHLYPALPQRVLQLIRRTPWAGKRQAVEHFIQAGGVGTGRAVQARATNGHLHPFVIGRLGVNTSLVLEDILVAADPSLLNAVHVDVIGATGHAFELRLGDFCGAGLGRGDFNRRQLQAFGLYQRTEGQGGKNKRGVAQQHWGQVLGIRERARPSPPREQ